MKGFDLSHCDLVVAADDYLGAQLPQVLDEVIGKRVVIVENEDHERLCSGYTKASDGQFRLLERLSGTRFEYGRRGGEPPGPGMGGLGTGQLETDQSPSLAVGSA